MSGGVDSSVVAILLQKQGFEVVGITLEFYQNIHLGYVKELKNIADSLGIEHSFVSLIKEFSETVISYFTEGYLTGNTPFPCAYCNPKMKWKALLGQSVEHKCTYVATGHYVQKAVHEGRNYIKKGIDEDKDQSFFLWGLEEKAIEKTLFPLGSLTKTKVREIAKENGYKSLSKKKDSLGVCFLNGKDYRDFLSINIKEEKAIPVGNFIDIEGNVLGKHKGYPYYTIGQRKGLNFNKPTFVLEVDCFKNEVVLGEYSHLFKNILYLKGACFINIEEAENCNNLIVKVRYRKQENSCKIKFTGEKKAVVYLNKPLAAVAPGQAAVFYSGDKVLGGGFIDKTE